MPDAVFIVALHRRAYILIRTLYNVVQSLFLFLDEYADS